MKFKILLLAGSLSCASAGAVQVQAATFTERDSTYSISFSGGLDTASTLYTVTATLPAGGSDAIGGALNYKSGFQNFTFSTTGTVTHTYAAPTAGTTSEIGNILNGGSGGTWGFSYSTPNSPNFSTGWTISSTALKHKVLAFGGVGSQGFGGCGSGFVDTGGIFTCEVFIQGKHPEGTAVGDAYITNLGAGYGVVDNFGYNSVLDATILSVSTGSYAGVGPALGFNIVGAAVPEPATWAIMLAGFGGLGAAMRGSRRKQAAVPA
jgi:hypothetical protein